MILGMSTPTFTLFHVILSLVAIATGLIVLFGMVAGRILRYWNGTFLVTTIATSVTGFFFPITHLTPGIKLGILSLVVLTLAVVALWRAWLKTYVISASIALYLNVFVLIVQMFEKVPSLHALAPTQTERPFLVAQIVTLAVFLALMVIAVRKFGTPALSTGTPA